MHISLSLSIHIYIYIYSYYRKHYMYVCICILQRAGDAAPRLRVAQASRTTVRCRAGSRI